jgi:hypothetical protein
MRQFRRRVLAVLLPLAFVAAVIASAMLWVDQQRASARVAEAELAPALARAEAAEARAVRAEASLTAIGVQRAAEVAATATTVARANEPQRTLERALGRLFTAFQQPTGPDYDRLADLFSESAVRELRREGDFLRGMGRHLGGDSTFIITPSPLEQLAPDRVRIHTLERWLYDERDEADNRARCFVEDSEQNYVLRLSGQTWLVDEYELGSSRRMECPS